ncbi:MAG: hypothetical protein HYS81_01890 [Candidatus Aenigmatarchaeota archaeon]|nr:MAG: hypothetical protein HYS81_01890 [Candidatus Aenigmarchaeota archaeon]
MKARYESKRFLCGDKRSLRLELEGGDLALLSKGPLAATAHYKGEARPVELRIGEHKEELRLDSQRGTMDDAKNYVVTMSRGAYESLGPGMFAGVSGRDYCGGEIHVSTEEKD